MPTHEKRIIFTRFKQKFEKQNKSDKQSLKRIKDYTKTIHPHKLLFTIILYQISIFTSTTTTHKTPFKFNLAIV